MTHDLQQTIIDVTEMTCETLAFMFPMPAPEEGIDPGEQCHEDLVRTRVRFDGPFEGSLVVTIPRSMLRSLAANMLGLKPQATTRDQRADAACELCNVVCGNLLPAVAGTEPVFSVSPLRLCEAPPCPDSADCVSARAWFDEGWVEVQFSVDAGLDTVRRPEEGGPGPTDLRSVA